MFIFFSYSHRDEAFRDELEMHLAPLKRQGVVEAWHDRRIDAGSEIDGEIDEYLEKADIILLLVSVDFLASNYCWDVEMARGLKRHSKGEARVIPVILRPCDWHDTPLGTLLALPQDGKPVSKFADKDDAFLQITKGIRKIVTEKRSSLPSPIPTVRPSQVDDPTIVSKVRTSNLRVKKEFSDRQRDQYLEESFEYISNFFDNSLNELSVRNDAIDINFRRVDANTFSATIYKNGSVSNQCRIWLGDFMGHGRHRQILLSIGSSGSFTSYNECLAIEEDGYMMSLKAQMGMLQNRQDQTTLSQQGAAEYLWDYLIRPLQ